MTVEDGFTWTELDEQFKLTFFYCRICPLTIPFLVPRNARLYMDGHRHNAYHKRRLELLE